VHVAGSIGLLPRRCACARKCTSSSPERAQPSLALALARFALSLSLGCTPHESPPFSSPPLSVSLSGVLRARSRCHCGPRGPTVAAELKHQAAVEGLARLHSRGPQRSGPNDAGRVHHAGRVLSVLERGAGRGGPGGGTSRSTGG
jgi:hypothetical protein